MIMTDIRLDNSNNKKASQINGLKPSVQSGDTDLCFFITDH